MNNSLDKFQPIYVGDEPKPGSQVKMGCFTVILAAFLLLLVYFLLPVRHNILLLGLDSREGEGMVARSDTIVLMTVIPLRPDVGMLSIPRDLWIDIPGIGENRINTIHFFAESAEPGSGPGTTKKVISDLFDVPLNYTVRLRFDGVVEVVDAMGGVKIDLAQPMSGYQAGEHVLNGTQALAFVRDRSGSDDFARMARGQLFLKALWQQLVVPGTWLKIPDVIRSIFGIVETDIPVWLWPRLGFALLRAGPDGINTVVITREMVVPFTTAGGAQVLAPNWEVILPEVNQVFKK